MYLNGLNIAFVMKLSITELGSLNEYIVKKTSNDTCTEIMRYILKPKAKEMNCV